MVKKRGVHHLKCEVRNYISRGRYAVHMSDFYDAYIRLQNDVFLAYMSGFMDDNVRCYRNGRFSLLHHFSHISSTVMLFSYIIKGSKQ